MTEDKPKSAPQEAPVQDRLEARFREILATIPPEVRMAIEALGRVGTVEKVEIEGVRSGIAVDSARQLGQADSAGDDEAAAEDPAVLERKTAQLAVLKAIMDGDTTGPGNEDLRRKFQEMTVLAVSALATHPLIMGVNDGAIQFDFRQNVGFQTAVEDLFKSLAEILAPYAAITIVTNQRLYNEGQQYGLEGAFKNQNMNMLGGLMEDYFAQCLVGTTIPLTLKPGLESVGAERSSREALLKFCLRFYARECLGQLLPEYLNLLIEEKIKAKGALPVNFKAMADALTQTIVTRFPKFR